MNLQHICASEVAFLNNVVLTLFVSFYKSREGQHAVLMHGACVLTLPCSIHILSLNWFQVKDLFKDSVLTVKHRVYNTCRHVLAQHKASNSFQKQSTKS